MEQINISTSKRNQMIDITDKVKKIVSESNVKNGICVVYVPHTTAGITINEGADPSVQNDILSKLSELVPENEGYAHAEGNADAHIKSTLVGSNKTLIIEGSKIVLGRWQSIFFCEFDGPRKREIFVQILPR